MNLNKVFIFGNLTRDPDLKSLPSGIQVVSFGIATNRRVKRHDQWEDVPEFHNIVAFGKTAELINQYMRKGNSLFVEGRLQTRSWDKDGAKQYRTEIVAERVQFGPRKQGDSAQSERTQVAHDEADEIPSEDIPY